MNGWVLYKHSDKELKTESYEIHQFRKVAADNGIKLQVVSQEQFDLIVSRDDSRSIRLDGKVVPLPDFIIPRRGAATTYFCLAVLRHLERLGVYVVNKASSVETVRDKLLTQQMLAASDLPFAKTMLVRFPIDVDFVEQTLGFPVVVKTVSGSQGKGVFLASSREQFWDLLNLINSTNSGVNLILQEFVKSSRGRDLRVITVGGKAVACMKRVARAGSFKANFSGGGTAHNYPMTPEIEWLATEASRIFDLDVAGVDLLFDNGHFKICEVNSSPGFKGMESCWPQSIPQCIYDFIRVRLGRYPESASKSDRDTAVLRDDDIVGIAR